LLERERAWARESEREHKQWELQAEGEAGSLQSKEPDAGLDPGLWDHDPSQRQTFNQLSHPGVPNLPTLT